MREEDRGSRDLDRLPHRVLGRVGEVDEYPDAVQLADDLLAEGRESAVRPLPVPESAHGVSSLWVRVR